MAFWQYDKVQGSAVTSKLCINNLVRREEVQAEGEEEKKKAPTTLNLSAHRRLIFDLIDLPDQLRILQNIKLWLRRCIVTVLDGNAVNVVV